MKKNALLIALVVIVALACILAGCSALEIYKLDKNEEMSFTLTVGEEVDFVDYFTISTSSGDQIVVTEDMLDLSQVDLSKPGTFDVRLTYKGYQFVATFTVVSNQGGGNGGNQGGGNNGGQVVDLSDVFANYDDYDKWNFEVLFDVVVGDSGWTSIYQNIGLDFAYIYEYDGTTYTDYVGVDAQGVYTYYLDNLDGTYTAYNENTATEDFEALYIYVDYFELINLGDFEWVDENVNVPDATQWGDCYSASKPQDVGNDILGEYEDNTWTSINLYVKGNHITRIVAKADALDTEGNSVEYVYTLTFSKHGEIDFDLSKLDVVGDSTGGNQGGGDDGGNGGNQGGGDVVTGDVYSSIFTKADLSVGNGQVGYTANVGASSLDESLGLQFMQANGETVLTSKNLFTGVTSVTVHVSTNQANGMYVSVSVDGTALTSDGETEVFVANRGHDEGMLELTFVADAKLNGAVVVTLTPTASKKSMYISQIDVECGEVVSGGGSQGGGNQGGTTSNVMPNQTYDKNTFDSASLQDKMNEDSINTGYDPAVGLPTVGTYNALVIPVEIKGYPISSQDLANLNLALNGSESDTGWESVKTYYQQSSYGKLNLTFDVMSKYTTAQNSSYYENSTDDQGYSNGAEVILLEVLAALDGSIDYSKYDINKDGCIDAVYLIYSAPVDYVSDDSFYWAYVSWSSSEEQFDGLYPYTYLFAGFDFMGEAVKDSGNDYTDDISGLKINASTYIHETGHLLDLDDYYDYFPSQGSNDGLGGADMMDYTVGDHNAFSKLILDWIEPKAVVTTTQTITINAFESSGDCIIIPLNFDNSLYCEYLIIDLYSATGLNALHSNVTDSLLFDGAEYGVRIYHVSASISKPYGDEYGSFTDNNNSISDTALIKLVEGDGGNSCSNGGYSSASDLWSTGDTFSLIQSSYTRNDGKALNFDIIINSVTASSASITIEYKA